MFATQTALLLLAFDWVNAQATPGPILNVNVPVTVPSQASGTIEKGFPGYGVAVHAFANYAGNSTTPNMFSNNLISNIAQRIGTQVRVRVGGTSGDVASYVPSQSESILFPPGAKPGSIPRGLKLGPTYFEGFSTLSNVTWTYMAHLALNTTDAMGNSVAATQQALNHIGSNLDAIEIGNEIDIYPGKERPVNWGIADYIKQWKAYANAIETQALANTSYANTAIFQAPVYANHKAPWLISNTFPRGINDGKNIKYSSLHHYMITGNWSTVTLQGSFMNHTNVVSNLSYYSEPIQWLSQNQPEIPLVMGETESDTYSMNNTDYIGVFGSALWQVDYMLYGASIGISRMNIQLSTGFAYTEWNPVEYYGAPPAVYPSYYAHVFVADLIGNGNNIRIANIDLNLDQFSAYGVYDADSGALTKVALVNLREWNTTTSYERPASTVIVSLAGQGGLPPAFNWPSLISVQRLTAPGADSLSNITWAGTSFTYESNGKPVQVSPSTEAVWALGGWVPVTVQASEAVLITLP